MRAVMVLALAACSNDEPVATDTGATEAENAFPLPPDIDTIDWQSVFQDAITTLKSVNTQAVWRGHLASLESRQAGCPDFWSGQFTVGTQTVGEVDGVAWFDDCRIQKTGVFYDGWLTWTADVIEEGDPETFEGRTSDADRVIEGDAVVGDADGVRLEFDGTARDSIYRLEAYGYERFVYSSFVNGTLTGRDVFEGTSTPEGFRTDLLLNITGGDVDTFEARGNAYLFEPQLQERFDSIQVDMFMPGPTGAGLDDCTLEPVGWLGVRDPEAYWYDVVFLPRFREDLAELPYDNPELSDCDGCGRLYIQGIEQEGVDVCIDFSFLFDGSFPLPDADEYVLPFHGL